MSNHQQNNCQLQTCSVFHIQATILSQQSLLFLTSPFSSLTFPPDICHQFAHTALLLQCSSLELTTPYGHSLQPWPPIHQVVNFDTNISIKVVSLSCSLRYLCTLSHQSCTKSHICKEKQVLCLIINNVRNESSQFCIDRDIL